jgi:hypothetical protein
MTPLGYPKTIMEEFAEIKEMSDKLGCNVMCPAKERYDESTTEEYEEEIRETKD